MEHVFEWIATGLATSIVALSGFIIHTYSNEQERQKSRLDKVAERVGEAEERLSFIEGVMRGRGCNT